MTLEEAWTEHQRKKGRAVSPGNIKHSQELQAAERYAFAAGYAAAKAEAADGPTTGGA